MSDREVAQREKILGLVKEYCAEFHQQSEFVPGQSTVPVSGRVYDGDDMASLVDSALDFWLTTGRFNEAFETRFAELVGAKHCLTVNSGSSANLVAFSALTSDRLGKHKLNPGDEVITAASGFPTTLNPIIQNGMTPVFVDVKLGTYNVDPEAVAAAITPKTKAIMIAHTLGNPFDVGPIKELVDEHDLYLIEDCCDALGATYDGQHVGTFGEIGTCSFYPAHHITMGEGGAVFANRNKLARIMASIRDWGRDCFCAPGVDNTCGVRFGWKLGNLPKGFDHKYTYSHLGYNLKITDMQAAIGLSQLDHLDDFVASRRKNFSRMLSGLADLNEFFILPEPTPRSEPSWFGFPLTVTDSAPFSRDELLQHLNANNIGTRLLFGANLIDQPYMISRDFKVAGSLANAEKIVTSTFWLGVYPGLGDAAIDYMCSIIHDFCRSAKSTRIKLVDLAPRTGAQ